MMTNLSRVLMVLALVPACVAGSDDGMGGGGGGGGKADDTNDEDRTLSASWQLQALATGQALACPTGYDTLALYSQEIDGAGEPVGSPIVDLYNCADGLGDAVLAPGRYRVWAEITTDNNSATYAQSTSGIVDLGATDKSISFSILADGGYFSVAWNLVGADTNQDLACADVPAIDGVELVATVAGSTDVTSDIWDCEDGYGMTAGLRAGTYTVSIDAMNDQSAALGVAAPLANRVIEPRNKVTHLGTIAIPIDGR